MRKKIIRAFRIVFILLFISAVSIRSDAATGCRVDVNQKAMQNGGRRIDVDVKSGQDITDTVNQALQSATAGATESNPSRVVIPAGDYSITAALHIYSNTVLEATGATIRYNISGKSVDNMILSGDTTYIATSSCKGYDGFRNIAIVGGTWIGNDSNKASLVKMMHASNVTFVGATFVGGGGDHQVEVAGIQNLLVSGCTFKDFKWKNDGHKREALQFDVPCAQAVFKGTYEDGTMMRNVTVQNCLFSNVPRGIGSHTKLMGAYNENIVIVNNEFFNVAEEAITALDYVDCLINGNTISKCGSGILIQSYKTSPASICSSVENGSYKKKKVSSLKTTISNNKIDIIYTGKADAVEAIKVYGEKTTKKQTGRDKKSIPKGDYRAYGVTIKNNTIKTAGYGVYLVGSAKCSVTKNTISAGKYNSKDKMRKKYVGIFLIKDCANNSITNNKITGISRDGIYIHQKSAASNITGNKISKVGNYGIGMYQSKVTGSISKNTISNCGNAGIFLSTSSSAAKVTGNTIKKVGGVGIGTYNKSKIKTLKSNKISGAKKGKIKKS